METLVVASNNDGKLDEISAILGSHFSVIGMKEAGFNMDIEENGSSFVENARIKAKTIHDIIGGNVLADDSGLCIDALDGAPGIYSARFFGKDTAYEDKFKEINRLLAGISEDKRTAQFVCAIVLIDSFGNEFVSEGRVHGVLLSTPRGTNGFGYDPIFYVPELKKTTSEISDIEKNLISHRGRALTHLLQQLEMKHDESFLG